MCDFSGRAFVPAGPRSRRDAKCPKCGARERHRLLWCYIKNEIDWAESNKDILYIAPTDPITEKLRELECNITNVDLNMPDVDVHLDMTNLPFDSQSFDGIICSHVLEHIPDDRAAMSEMYRILAPNGVALVMVPKAKTREDTYEDESITSPRDREKEFGTRSHVRLYGMDISQRLSETGFDVSVVTYARELGKEATERYGLRIDEQFLERELEDIHYCKKSHSTSN
ncbi:class I SAM-dependent methyltransferase [Halovenus sp. HT40]|uniref:class I SAM-dependent methyltransferase n=1 Tax=Halovenus sp. HT40 TaxID=3126691 RepID=UPI00300EAEBA